MLHFGADTNPWHSNHHNEIRLGEFLLYDEYDPRRTILFNAAGQTWGCTRTRRAGTPARAARLSAGSRTSSSSTTRTSPATTSRCVHRGRQPGQLHRDERNQPTDGSDVVFGDLGNDWLVGGTGQDTLWGGWGNDLQNADDDLHSGCVTAQPNGTCTLAGDTWLNDTPDGVNSSFQDRVYGGAGLDILIGNTGGDRLIDWVGEFNSYIVPFAPFGIATVSRQNEPQLPEFLYALSRSQGVDMTRWSDEGSQQVRNGEPFGELGLIRQEDHGCGRRRPAAPPTRRRATSPAAVATPCGDRTSTTGRCRASRRLRGVRDHSGRPAGDRGRLHGRCRRRLVLRRLQERVLRAPAKISMDKPTGGWKANSYIVFDYFAPADFKFAGIDQSTNKMVIGVPQRVAAGTPGQARSPAA